MSAGMLQAVQSFVASLLDLGRTRFELFSTELREELARLATAVIGGLAVLILVALGFAFAGLALILHVGEESRLAATIGVALFFLVAAAVVAWLLRRLAETKPRAFDATLSELQRDLNTIRR
ncbi:MAG TPA: phage holin family protein [Burkholderiales bacterium]|nr:phage holin family protein [Burkholderiales bacterium]